MKPWVRVLVMGLLAGFLAGFLLAYQPRHPVTVLRITTCQTEDGYLVVMSDGALTVVPPVSPDDETTSAIVQRLIAHHPAWDVDTAGCT